MADISPRTQDVTIRDDVTADAGNVNASNEQLVHDADVLTGIENISSNTDGLATSWQFFCENDLGFVTTHAATLAGGAGEKDYILLENPAASGYLCRIKRFDFGVQTTATAATFSLYMHPVVSANGTVLNIENYKDIDAAGVINAYHTPTITDREHIFEQFSLNSSGVGLASRDEDLALYVEEGEFILFTIEQFAANKSFTVNVSWAEELIPT